MVNKNKRRIRHCHHPIQISRVLELKASRQYLHIHPWQWYCYHPACLSLAQHSLQRYLFWQYMVGQSCSCQDLCHWSSRKENKLHEHNPILTLRTIVLLLPLVHGQVQTKSKLVCPFAGHNMMITSLQWRENCIFETIILCSGMWACHHDAIFFFFNRKGCTKYN